MSEHANGVGSQLAVFGGGGGYKKSSSSLIANSAQHNKFSSPSFTSHQSMPKPSSLEDAADTRLRMMQKESILNRNSNYVAVRSDPHFLAGFAAANDGNGTKPGSREEIERPGEACEALERSAVHGRRRDEVYPSASRAYPGRRHRTVMPPPLGPPPTSKAAPTREEYNATIPSPERSLLKSCDPPVANNKSATAAASLTPQCCSLPERMHQQLKSLRGSALSISEIVHLASVSKPSYDVAMVAAAVTMGISNATSEEGTPPSAITNPQQMWGATQRTLIKASDLASKLKKFDATQAALWRLKLIKLAVTEVEGGPSFSSFGEVCKFNKNASRAVGKLFLWAYNVCVAAGVLDTEEDIQTGGMPNNNDSEDDSIIIGSGRRQLPDKSSGDRECFSSPAISSAPSKEASSALHSSRPTTSPLNSSSKSSKTLLTTPKFSAKLISNSPGVDSGGPHMVAPRPSTSPVQFINDIESIEKTVYGGNISPCTSNSSSSTFNKSKSCSSNFLDVRASSREESSPTSSSTTFSSKTSPTSSEGEEEDCDSGESFTFSLGNLDKLTISMSNLDKLLKKTPSFEEAAHNEIGASACRQTRKGQGWKCEGNKLDKKNPHLMLQQWMMFPMIPTTQDVKQETAAPAYPSGLVRSIGGGGARASTLVRCKSSGSNSSGGSGSISDSISEKRSNGSIGGSSTCSEYETDTDYESSEGEHVEVIQGHRPKYAPPIGPPPRRNKKEVPKVAEEGTQSICQAQSDLKDSPQMNVLDNQSWRSITSSVPPPSTPAPKKIRKLLQQQQQQQQQRRRKEEEEEEEEEEQQQQQQQLKKRSLRAQKTLQSTPPRSLLEAARSKIANPRNVHGKGVERYF